MELQLLDHGLYRMSRKMGVMEEPYDVIDTDDSILFSMGVPGLSEKDIDVKVGNGQRLIIKSKRESRFTPIFRFVFILPCKINETETMAMVKMGVITIRLAKRINDYDKNIW